MRRLKPSGLMCFSPPVMIATFGIEIALALYAVWRYKLNLIGRLAVAMLVFLAIFQLAEFNICEGSWGVDALTWSRIGYVAITMLPPLGIHLAYAIVGRQKPKAMPWIYGAAGAFIVFFAFIGHSLTSQVCLGNYVIFSVAPGSQYLYSLYYYGLMLFAVWLCWKSAKGQASNIRKALYCLAIGYLAFILPTTTINIVDPQTIAGIPSIMCGFAVIYALILATWILPFSATSRKNLAA